ncbi:unnamed protein product [Rotaria sp. Silwood2]|nr:unnamed protein product [Rotaria sp. Silwood2]
MVVGCGRRAVISIDGVLLPRPTPSKVFAKFLNPSPFTTSNARAPRAQKLSTSFSSRKFNFSWNWRCF